MPVHEPKLKANGSVKDDAPWIGVVSHAMLHSWAVGDVSLPSQTVFAPNPRNTDRTLFVAATITDNFAKWMGSPKLMGTPIGAEMLLSADATLWGEKGWGSEQRFADLGISNDEIHRPYSGILDYVTWLNEEQARTLQMLLLNTRIKPGLTIWDWKTMGYHHQVPGHTNGYQSHGYQWLGGGLGLQSGVEAHHGGYPANFMYVCIERGTGVAPRISNPIVIRKEDPDPDLDRALVESYIVQAARSRAANIQEVRLDLCVDKFNQPCRWGPGGRGLCNQRPGLEIVE